MRADQIVVLPGKDGEPLLLKELKGPTHIGLFIEELEKNPQAVGFESKAAFELFLDQTLYQIDTMVVKSEDFRIFMDGAGKILERTPGKQEAIRLINACGIRGIHSSKTPGQFNKQIMTETFKAAIKASEKGIAVFPAVRMGIWRGDPDLYWKAFLDAVLTADNLKMICVNPGHQPPVSGPYKGCKGEEFQQILDEYLTRCQGDERLVKNLRKVLNLYESKKDVVQLAYQLKLAYPDKIILLFNASDLDVTLGYYVGEYTNNFLHANTTEENYTAMGINNLCFECVTRVHASAERLIQA